ncbi:MAG: DUF4956 domain-containing protein [Eubacteriales bacterium]
MTFDDILKSSFLEKAVDFSILDVALGMLVAFALGLFVFAVYKKTFAGVMYSASFGISLIAMSLITTMIIMAVTSNIILSLGMVGALSIVRFRTAVKEPLDIAFLFWAISVGIVTGAGLIPLGVLGSIFIGVILVIFANKKSNDTPYIIIVNCEDDSSETEVLSKIKSKTKKTLLKSKNVSKNGIELILEVRLLEATAKIVNELLLVEGVSNAVLVSYNGEYMN